MIHMPTGLLWQKSPLMWIHLRISPKRNILPYYEAVAQTVILGKKQALTYFGKEPDIIVQPYSVGQDTWLKQHSTDWLLAQIGFIGTIDNHYPQDRLIKFLNVHEVIFPNMTSLQPLHNAVLVFTDGSSKGRAGFLISNQEVIIKTPGISAQLAELTVKFLRCFVNNLIILKDKVLWNFKNSIFLKTKKGRNYTPMHII